MSIYVGMTGKAGAGKDWIADILIGELDGHGITAEKLPWAQGVRREIEHVLDARLPNLWVKPTPYPVRRLLQWWGTDFRRAEDPDYWVKWGLESAQISDAEVIFFTDTRFPNEVRAIYESGGFCINVWASDVTRKTRVGDVPAHESEVHADQLESNYSVKNESGNIFLSDKVMNIIREIIRRVDA